MTLMYWLDGNTTNNTNQSNILNQKRNFTSGFLRYYPAAGYLTQPEDDWSCIAHLSAKDMLKPAVIEEKKF